MNSNEAIKKDNDSKKIFATLIMIFTLMFCTTGATYAWLALTPATNNTITGTVAGGGLTLTVTKMAPTTVTKLVPQLGNSTSATSPLNNAITNYSCVDANNNTVCLVYKVVVSSTVTSSDTVLMQIAFAGIESMPNLKWKLMSTTTNATAISGLTLGTSAENTASTTATQFASFNITGSAVTKYYYLVFWINETNAVQTDSGTFRATITAGNASGKITSTITSSA